MFTSREDLSQVFSQYICSGWMEREKNANKLIDQLFDTAKGGSVADLYELFARHYMMESPLDGGEVWKYLFNIKALAVWDDPEQMLNVYYMAVLHDWEVQAEENEAKKQAPAAPAPQVRAAVNLDTLLKKANDDAAKEISHLGDLSLKEQAAFMRELEINTDSISWEFFEKLTKIYPKLVEAFGFYLEFALREGDYMSARLCIEQLMKQYPDDYELLKKQLDIYSIDGKPEEVHKYAASVVDYLKKNPRKSAYDLTHYAGQTQISVKDYSGAAETYSYLITNYSQLDSTNPDELRSQFSLFYEIFGIPAPYLKDKIMLFVVQFTFFLANAAKEGVDLNSDKCASMLGNTVLRLSEKLAYDYIRTPFTTLLDSLEEQKLLRFGDYHNIIVTGYSAAESFYIGEDATIRDEIRQGLLNAYNGADAINSDQYELLNSYYNLSPAHMAALKDKYPIIAEHLPGILSEFRKKQAKKNPWSDTTVSTVKRMEKKIGRNDPCPCGSGRKYKQCCGKGK